MQYIKIYCVLLVKTIKYLDFFFKKKIYSENIIKYKCVLSLQKEYISKYTTFQLFSNGNNKICQTITDSLYHYRALPLS